MSGSVVLSAGWNACCTQPLSVLSAGREYGPESTEREEEIWASSFLEELGVCKSIGLFYAGVERVSNVLIEKLEIQEKICLRVHGTAGKCEEICVRVYGTASSLCARMWNGVECRL